MPYQVLILWVIFRNQKAITYVTQEMLKNNILASNVIYISISHKKICGYILKKFRKIFRFLGSLKNKNLVSKYLLSKERYSQLRRFN